MMNKRMLVAGLMGALLAAGGVRAEDKDKGVPPPEPRRIIRPAPLPTPDPMEEEPRFDLAFAGGKLPEFLEATASALKSVSKAPLNVVVPAEDADTMVPAFHLQGVTVRELFAALGAASQRKEASRIVGVIVPGISANIWDSSWGFDETKPGSNVWVFHTAKMPKVPEPTPTPESKPIASVWQLNGYLLKGLTVEDITTAIQVAWKVGGIEPPPELKYHAETGLLLAAGSEGAIETITRVLNGLPDSPDEEPPARKHIRPAPNVP